MHVFDRKQRFLLAIIPPLAALLIRALSLTFRYRDVYPLGVRPLQQLQGPYIVAFWHCAILASACRFGPLHVAVLISDSFDGELIARTSRLLGYRPVRGSSTRGGAAGLRALEDAYNAGNICAFTVDGPRGPARVAKYGAVRLAELTGAPLIGVYHAQPDRFWQLRSWDGFMIPKPFATITITWPTPVAPDLPRLQQALEDAVAMIPR